MHFILTLIFFIVLMTSDDGGSTYNRFLGQDSFHSVLNFYASWSVQFFTFGEHKANTVYFVISRYLSLLTVYAKANQLLVMS